MYGCDLWPHCNEVVLPQNLWHLPLQVQLLQHGGIPQICRCTIPWGSKKQAIDVDDSDEMIADEEAWDKFGLFEATEAKLLGELEPESTWELV